MTFTSDDFSSIQLDLLSRATASESDRRPAGLPASYAFVMGVLSPSVACEEARVYHFPRIVLTFKLRGRTSTLESPTGQLLYGTDLIDTLPRCIANQHH